MTAGQGFKTFRERAVAPVFKELKQLGDLNAVGEQDLDVLTWAQKNRFYQQ